jgi:hypothetical protein
MVLAWSVDVKHQNYFGELMLAKGGVTPLCELLKIKQMHWNQTYQKIYANEAEDVIVSFQMVKDKEIKEILPSCGCISYTFVENILKTKVHATPVKIQLPEAAYEKGIREYTIRKNFRVKYEDGTEDRLIYEIIVNE